MNYENDIVLKKEDLDFVGKLFGMVVSERTYDGKEIAPLVELFIEDDENYFFKCDFDIGWLDDLISVACRVRESQKEREST